MLSIKAKICVCKPANNAIKPKTIAKVVFEAGSAGRFKMEKMGNRMMTVDAAMGKKIKYFFCAWFASAFCNMYGFNREIEIGYSKLMRELIYIYIYNIYVFGYREYQKCAEYTDLYIVKPKRSFVVE